MAEITTYLKKVKPDTVILEMGTNDLDCTESAQVIANRLVRECERWLNLPFIDCLVWCHVIQRNKVNSKPIGMDRYNRKVSALNKKIAMATAQSRNFHHWSHKGLFLGTKKDCPDGVHPDSKSGMAKYKYSLERLCKWSKKNMIKP